MNRATIFDGIRDIFGGITVSSDKQSWKNVEDFEVILEESIKKWQNASIRGVWFKIPLSQAELVPVMAKHDFVFHHAQPQYVMMTRWLSQDEPNMLPGYASHYIGVGGFVLNEQNQLLVIRELYGSNNSWKLPGGAVDPGEALPSAVCREVLEETGIHTEFLSIGCFRHLLQFRFGRSDIYFVCHLRPLTSEIKVSPNEIAACKWMDIDEFFRHPSVQHTNKYFVQLCMDGLSQGEAACIRPKMSGSHHVYSILPARVNKSVLPPSAPEEETLESKLRNSHLESG